MNILKNILLSIALSILLFTLLTFIVLSNVQEGKSFLVEFVDAIVILPIIFIGSFIVVPVVRKMFSSCDTEKKDEDLHK